MATWDLEPTRENLHGHFSRDLQPILTIQSGDTVNYRTLDAGWHAQPPTGKFGPRPPQIEPRDPMLDAGHCLVGPIKIIGAEPGMTLEIQINEITVGNWGWTRAWFPSPVNDWLGIADKPAVHGWSLDPDAMRGLNQHGFEISLRPFMGVMGMPPDEPGILSTSPPRETGGNLDCKELVVGTSLFLPIAVSGGLFSVGDGHAAQGDGEVCGTAIECPMDNVSLTFKLHQDMHLKTARIKTETAWMTLGVDKDLQEATLKALADMLDLIGDLYGLQRSDAIALASLVVDMRITQIANGVLGVHAVLPLDAISAPTG